MSLDTGTSTGTGKHIDVGVDVDVDADMNVDVDGYTDMDADGDMDTSISDISGLMYDAVEKLTSRRPRCFSPLRAHSRRSFSCPTSSFCHSTSRLWAFKYFSMSDRCANLFWESNFISKTTHQWNFTCTDLSLYKYWYHVKYWVYVSTHTPDEPHFVKTHYFSFLMQDLLIEELTFRHFDGKLLIFTKKETCVFMKVMIASDLAW